MRFVLLAACAAALLSGCDKKDSAEQNASAVQNLDAATISSNDTTSIDAASAADANMAADVQLTVNDLEADNADQPEGNSTDSNESD